MASGLAVYVSRGGYPLAAQDSLPGAGQALLDGLSTRRAPMKGFKLTSCSLSSFPKLLGTSPFSSPDRVEYGYNRQAERIRKKDQNETVHAYEYDRLGRPIEDRVTAVGSGVDDAVRRIATTYEANNAVLTASFREVPRGFLIKTWR